MVNSIELTKLDRRVLEAIENHESRDYYYVQEGNYTLKIAEAIYGDCVLNCEKRGGRYVSDLRLSYAAKSSLCRTLNKLHRKGLVKKCKPIYVTWWCKKNGDDTIPHKRRDLIHLRATSINENGLWRVENISLKEREQWLPDKIKIWWVLTDRAKELLKGLT